MFSFLIWQLLRSTKHLVKELYKWQDLPIPSYIDNLDLVQLIHVSSFNLSLVLVSRLGKVEGELFRVTHVIRLTLNFCFSFHFVSITSEHRMIFLCLRQILNGYIQRVLTGSGTLNSKIVSFRINGV